MSRTSYSYAVVRVVPRVHLWAFANVGVVVHARTAGFLDVRLLSEPHELNPLVRGVDLELLARYLRSWRSICLGEPHAGTVALAPPSERFHWLTAPRSDILQASPVHTGLCAEPALALEELFSMYVRAPR
ncbi:MAG: DUF3037 domain-containing protein [Gemmatimonadetes bacterium]|nr:DUF3037 domain-containing protein [Gemmatimonadota bacterium]